MQTASRPYAICTLSEGDYHHGVATLINSLINVGYDGHFWLGYRGELPAWIRRKEVQQSGLGEFVELNPQSMRSLGLASMRSF
jgi:hypothetical protein